MLAGLGAGAAGLLALTASGPGTPYWRLVLPMLAAGAGMALTMPAATTAVMEPAPAGRGGTAAGLLNAARQVGGAVGVAVGGSLVSGRLGFVPGLRLALAGCGGAFLLGGIVTLAAMGRAAGWPPDSRHRPRRNRSARTAGHRDRQETAAVPPVSGGCGPGGLPIPSTAAGTRAGSRTARSAG